MEVLFITMKITLIIPFYLYDFKDINIGLQAMEENIRTRDYVPQITGDNRQILGRFDNCTHSKTVRKVVGSRVRS